MKTPPEGISRRAISEVHLGMKELLQLAAIMSVFTGLVTTIVAYIHADITIPKILHQTAMQIDKAIERHTVYPHPVSASKEDVEKFSEMIKEDIREWKQEIRERLSRIEKKL